MAGGGCVKAAAGGDLNVELLRRELPLDQSGFKILLKLHQKSVSELNNI